MQGHATGTTSFTKCFALEMQGRRDARAIPAVLEEEQWEALGRRLQGIESSLQVSQALHPVLRQPALSWQET